MVDIWLSLLEPWNCYDRLYGKNVFETVSKSSSSSSSSSTAATRTRNTLKTAASILSNRLNGKERKCYSSEWEYYVENHYPVFYSIYTFIYYF